MRLIFTKNGVEDEIPKEKVMDKLISINANTFQIIAAMKDGFPFKADGGEYLILPD